MGLRGRARRGGGDPRQTKRLSPLHFGAPSDPCGRAGRGASAPPSPPSPQPRRPRPSPSSSRWMMLSMLSLSISAIASQRPGGAPPRRSARGSAGPTPLLVLSRFCPFLLRAVPGSLCPPRPLSTEPALNKMAAVPQRARRRTDTTSATRPVGNPL